MRGRCSGFVCKHRVDIYHVATDVCHVWERSELECACKQPSPYCVHKEAGARFVAVKSPCSGERK